METDEKNPQERHSPGGKEKQTADTTTEGSFSHAANERNGNSETADPLLPHHRTMLETASAISPQVIQSRGYRSITEAGELLTLGFTPRQARVPGLLLPLHTTDGLQPFCVYRPDVPRLLREKIVKYEMPAKQGMRLDCPPLCREQLADPKIPLWLTEGQKKGDALASHGQCAVALLGVWNFKGKNDFGGVTFLADFDHIGWPNRDVRVVFDNDTTRKPSVRKALERLTEHLQRKGATVRAVYLPLDGPKGVDDFLASGKTISDLEALMEGPRPQPQAAHPIAELLNDAPLMIRRPLALIDGTAYAAIWPYVKTTVRETVDKAGNIITLNPPQVETKQRLLIVRGDGRVFGDGGDAPLADLGCEVHLPETPQGERVWSTPAVNAYRTGARPDPVNVFHRIVAVVDTFLDFDRSLADQIPMCEMLACYIVSTYFLEAFTVVGFLWPNGESGSGKTQLLLVVTELAYLGQTILAGGSFASLRDLADYGACLAFDDAENLSDPRTDPDKRTLLLAGNRKGNTVPLKEPGPDRTWKTRYVNTFSPRLFSAIRLPDAVLASRTIIVPLIKTIDEQKANADPLNYELWPHDRRKLMDNLWALGLAHLPDFKRYETLVNAESALSGRTLEPWRALLSVAKWLDGAGVAGLFARMSTLSEQYQQERPDLEGNSLIRLVLHALLRCCETSIKSVSSMASIKKEGSTKKWNVKTKDITDTAKAIATEEEQDTDPEKITSRRIGRTLGRLRLKKDPDTSKRAWIITETDLARLILSFGLANVKKEEKKQPGPSHTNACHAGDAFNACPDSDQEGKTTSETSEPVQPSEDEQPEYQGDAHGEEVF